MLAYWLVSYQLPGKLCLVAIGKRFLDGEDDAIGDDGEQDGVLEGRPLDQELGGPPEVVGLGEDEERGRPRLLLLVLLLLGHGGGVGGAGRRSPRRGLVLPQEHGVVGVRGVRGDEPGDDGR